MAAGNIVPWTYPGGPPCCCAAECYTNFETDPFGNNLAAGHWQEITESDYVAMLAGGIYNGAIVANITGTNANGFETQTANESQQMSVVATANGGCYLQAQSLENIVVTASRDGGFSKTVSFHKFGFSRTLGTQSGVRYLNLSTVDPIFATITSLVFSFAYRSGAFGVSQVAFVGNAENLLLGSNQQLSTAVSTINFVVNSNTYSQSGIFVQTNSLGTQSNIMSGGATLTVTLTPSAP